MQLRNTSASYGAIAKFLHWGIVILIISQYLIIESAEEMADGPGKLQAVALHKSLGMLVFGLALVRIAWRFLNGRKPPPLPMPRVQRMAAAAGHGLLYVLILAQPLSGWLMSSSAGYPVSFFGLFTLPALAGKDPGAHEFYEEVHEALFVMLATVALVHALAALYHHFWRKDDTLRRMLPFLRLRRS
jgi:cytochrome b561